MDKMNSADLYIITAFIIALIIISSDVFIETQKENQNPNPNIPSSVLIPEAREKCTYLCSKIEAEAWYTNCTSESRIANYAGDYYDQYCNTRFKIDDKIFSCRNLTGGSCTIDTGIQKITLKCNAR